MKIYRLVFLLCIMFFISLLVGCRNEYSVKFYDYYDNVISEQLIKEGDNAIAPKNPDLVGYDFISWDKEYLNISSDLEIRPLYQVKKFNVKFIDADGKTLKTEIVEYGQAATEPIAPDKEGHIFLGWDKDFNNVLEDLVISPVYEILKFNVKFYDNDGNIIKEEIVSYGEEVEAPNDPVLEDYQFINWDKDFTKVLNDLEIYPIFEKIIFTIKFIDDEEIVTLKVNKGEKITKLVDLKYQDELFLGWMYQNKLYDFNLEVNNDLELTAIWKSGEIIKLGACGPISGFASMYGIVSKNGINLAIEEINLSGGIIINDKSYQLELVEFIDDQMQSELAIQALNKLIEKDIDIFVGAITSAATESLFREAIKKGIPVITPTATSDIILNDQNGNERLNCFRACFYESYQGQYMANFAFEKGVKSTYILYNNDEDYSIGLIDSYISKAKELGIDITLGGYDKTVRDFKEFAEIIKNGDYDSVYVVDYYENVEQILYQLQEINYKGIVLGCDGWDGLTSALRYNFDLEFLNNCYYTNHFIKNTNRENVKEFVNEYKNKYNEAPSIFSALSYDTIYMIKQALENCEAIDYSGIIKALNNTTYQDLLTSIKDVKFDYNGNPIKDCIIITFKDGIAEEAAIN